MEYALKAVENSGTCLDIKAKDGIVLALEKLVASKLLVPNSNTRIHTIDMHIGFVGICIKIRLQPDFWLIHAILLQEPGKKPKVTNLFTELPFHQRFRFFLMKDDCETSFWLCIGVHTLLIRSSIWTCINNWLRRCSWTSVVHDRTLWIILCMHSN